MKIVLKELVNRVGLPTGSLICTLTTYTGFGRSALVRLCGGSAHPSNAGRLRQVLRWSLLSLWIPTSQGRFRTLLRAPAMCAWGTHGLDKIRAFNYYFSSTELTFFLYPFNLFLKTNCQEKKK